MDSKGFDLDTEQQQLRQEFVRRVGKGQQEGLTQAGGRGRVPLRVTRYSNVVYEPQILRACTTTNRKQEWQNGILELKTLINMHKNKKQAARTKIVFPHISGLALAALTSYYIFEVLIYSKQSSCVQKALWGFSSVQRMVLAQRFYSSRFHFTRTQLKVYASSTAPNSALFFFKPRR